MLRQQPTICSARILCFHREITVPGMKAIRVLQRNPPGSEVSTLSQLSSPPHYNFQSQTLVGFSIILTEFSFVWEGKVWFL